MNNGIKGFPPRPYRDIRLGTMADGVPLNKIHGLSGYPYLVEFWAEKEVSAVNGYAVGNRIYIGGDGSGMSVWYNKTHVGVAPGNAQYINADTFSRGNFTANNWAAYARVFL